MVLSAWPHQKRPVPFLFQLSLTALKQLCFVLIFSINFCLYFNLCWSFQLRLLTYFFINFIFTFPSRGRVENSFSIVNFIFPFWRCKGIVSASSISVSLSCFIKILLYFTRNIIGKILLIIIVIIKKVIFFAYLVLLLFRVESGPFMIGENSIAMPYTHFCTQVNESAKFKGGIVIQGKHFDR